MGEAAWSSSKGMKYPGSSVKFHDFEVVAMSSLCLQIFESLAAKRCEYYLTTTVVVLGCLAGVNAWEESDGAEQNK
jgi:hypothetical protein